MSGSRPTTFVHHDVQLPLRCPIDGWMAQRRSGSTCTVPLSSNSVNLFGLPLQNLKWDAICESECVTVVYRGKEHRPHVGPTGKHNETNTVCGSFRRQANYYVRTLVVWYRLVVEGCFTRYAGCTCNETAAWCCTIAIQAVEYLLSNYSSFLRSRCHFTLIAGNTRTIWTVLTVF